MKQVLCILLVGFALLTSCKTDSKKEVTYPDIWAQKEVPAFPYGMISNDKSTNDGLKSDNTVVVQSDVPFEEIYTWHINEFADKGWKKVKNTRKNIGQDDEVIILVHTKGKVKHSITVLKGMSGKPEIKTVVAVFGE